MPDFIFSSEPKALADGGAGSPWDAGSAQGTAFLRIITTVVESALDTVRALFGRDSAHLKPEVLFDFGPLKQAVAETFGSERAPRFESVEDPEESAAPVRRVLIPTTLGPSAANEELQKLYERLAAVFGDEFFSRVVIDVEYS
jgi:hypothetical protein